MEAAPPPDLDRDRVPRPLLEGDDRSAVKAARPESKNVPTREDQEGRVSTHLQQLLRKTTVLQNFRNLSA